MIILFVTYKEWETVNSFIFSTTWDNFHHPPLNLQNYIKDIAVLQKFCIKVGFKNIQPWNLPKFFDNKTISHLFTSSNGHTLNTRWTWTGHTMDTHLLCPGPPCLVQWRVPLPLGGGGGPPTPTWCCPPPTGWTGPPGPVSGGPPQCHSWGREGGCWWGCKKSSTDVG